MHKFKMATTCFALSFLFVFISTAGATVIKTEVDGIMYQLDLEKSTAEVTYYGDDYLFLGNSYKGDVVIPEKIIFDKIEYYVTEIGEGAFYYCSGIKSVYLPNSIQVIGDYSFSLCQNLERINIPEKIRLIGASAFRGCTKIHELNIPKGIESIGESAFEMCRELSYINLPEGITSIPPSVFRGCKSLKSMIIPSSVKTIGESAFENNDSLKEVLFPEGLECIGDRAFKNDSVLGVSYLPRDLVSIGISAFENCFGIEEILIPQNVLTIGDAAFKNDSILRNVALNENLYSIGINVFYKCSELESVILPKGMKYIPDGTFYRCAKLSKVNWPEGLETIGNKSFYNCESLISLSLSPLLSYIGADAFVGCHIENILAGNPRTKWSNAFSDRTLKQALVYVPSGSLDTAVYEGDWYLFTNLRETTTKVEDLQRGDVYFLMNIETFGYAVSDEHNNIYSVNTFCQIEQGNKYHLWDIKANGDKIYLLNEGSGLLYGVEQIDKGFSLNRVMGKWALIAKSSLYSGNKETSVSALFNNSSCEGKHYSVSGQEISPSQKGLHIIKYDNGVTSKRFIK